MTKTEPSTGQEHRDAEKKDPRLCEINMQAEIVDIELDKARTILMDLYQDYLAPKMSRTELYYYHDHARTLCEVVDDYLIKVQKMLEELHTLAGYPITD